MCTLACCLSMKLLCNIVRKYTPDIVLLVWQGKCACKVQDGLVRILKFSKKSGSLLKVIVFRCYTTVGGRNKFVFLQYLDCWDEGTS